MKDKSRFVSSVIVSLLAGFIYYNFGDNLQQKIQNSVKAVISSNDLELSSPSDCESFSSLVSNSKAKVKKKRLFVKKRNTIEFKSKSNGANIPGDEMFSEFISKSPAKFQRPAADKNPDFTAELQNLINGNNSKRQSKQNKITRSSVVNDEVTELNPLKSELKKLDKNFRVVPKNYHGKSTSNGNGFEFNFMKNESSGKNEKPTENTVSESELSPDKCNVYKSAYKKYGKYVKTKVKKTEYNDAPDCNNDDM